MTFLIERLTASQDFFSQLGWMGVLAYAGLIVVVQLCLAPLSPLAIAGGFIFGLGRGFIAITLGTAVGAALNFLIARHLARGFVAQRLERNEKFRLIDAAIGREGWKIIALLRFCPIPFGLANFAYGITAIPFWPYFITSVFAIVPANLSFVWFGATAQAGLEVMLGTNRPRHPLEYTLLILGLVAAFAAMTYIGKIARAAVAKQNLPLVES
jgi:uncharacterized membrane protein YdjX (TVP38/TMEM64 family)